MDPKEFRTASSWQPLTSDMCGLVSVSIWDIRHVYDTTPPSTRTPLAMVSGSTDQYSYQ